MSYVLGLLIIGALLGIVGLFLLLIVMHERYGLPIPTVDVAVYWK